MPCITIRRSRVALSHAQRAALVRRWGVRMFVAASFVRPSVSAAQETFRDVIRIADSAWASQRFAAAKHSYQHALDIDSLASSRAIYRLAVLRSWDGDLSGAVTLLTRYVRLEPRDDEGRIALARVYSWQGATQSAVEVYDAVFARDSSYRDAALGAAQALAWSGKYREALGRYDAWLARAPHDHEAALARAKTLAWAGRLGDAAQAYRHVAADGEPLEGRKGEAMIAAWRGDLFEAETQWTRLAREYPKDVRVWVGLAQTLRWSGRSQEARGALARALALAPNDIDARAERRYIEGALAPAIAPTMSWSWDSDGNRALYAQLRASLPATRLVTASLSASQRRSELGPLSATSSATRLSMQWFADRHLSLGATVGVVQAASDGGALPLDRTRVVGSGAATVKVTSRVAIGGYVGRDVFDETASGVASSLDVTTANVEGSVDMGGRLALGVVADRARFAGGSAPNERQGVAGSLRWRARRSLHVALTARTMGYDRQLHDGYFAPERYRLGELSGRYEPQRESGWLGFLEGGGGMQSVRANGENRSQATERLGVGLTRRWLNGNEIALEYGAGNVAGSAAIVGNRGVVYRYQSLSLRARLRLR